MSLVGLQGYLAYLPARTPVETFLVGLFVAVVAAKVVDLILKHVIDEVIRRTSTGLDDVLYEEFALPLMLSIVLLGGYISAIPLGAPERWMFYIRGVILSVLAVFWALATSRAGDKFFSRLHSSEEFDSKFVPVFENVWKFVVLIGTIFGLLAVWKINVTPLLASAGIAGIAIGFAAKDTVANFFGGIALYFDNTYKIGDFIVLDSGESGFVEDVGVRSTTIR
ncbi:MAG: mechanosensitive ion channel, partial [Candidatus Nanohaloarchaea archaeon]|nr:mechanosensitive ion channel [Candidatus Nanohaloarchaea archaeon]